VKVRKVTLITATLVLLIGLLIVAALYVRAFWDFSEFLRFNHRSPSYFAALATSCDVLLAQHPLGTNAYIELEETDPTIPEIIREMDPIRIDVLSNRVWILHGGAIRFGVTWMEDSLNTNRWVLSSTAEDHTRVLYLRSKK